MVLTELTTDSSKIEAIVLDDQKSRELRRIRTTRSAVYFYDVANEYTRMWTWRNEENRRNNITQGWEFCSLKYRVRKGMKKKIS